MKVAPNEVVLAVRVFCPAADGAARCYRASLLVDGETVIPLGEMRPDLGSFIDDAEGWLKGTYAVMPVKTFVRLGAARKIEIRVGRNNFELPERHVVALRETALKMKGAI